MRINRHGASLLFLILTFFFVAAITQTNTPRKDIKNYESALIDTVSMQSPGKTLYSEACAACHGVTGKGVAQSQLGFETPVPDFSDCDFSNREPDGDWIAVAHQGGPVRGFAKDMPAFGKALSEQQLQKIMDHIRTLCRDENWPRGELNMPRPLVTEKAYPEDEAVISTSVDIENEGNVLNELVYEQRFGARNQLEIVVPFGFSETPAGNWNGGQLGDVALGVKRALYHNFDSGSIFSAAGEVLFPTGDRATGFGKGTTIFEPFISFGQLLPANGFLQLQSGVELPLLRDKATEEAFWRAALGTSLTHGSWGRTWSPMVEVLGSREFESGGVNHWDIAPQVQVTLNKRQHIMMNVGVRIPADDASRDTQFMVYILWDWFDGGFFEGW
ncbi:MAG: c-type cytochrome [Bacteroidota bacterium]